jgi:hypothetical protein
MLNGPTAAWPAPWQCWSYHGRAGYGGGARPERWDVRAAPRANRHDHPASAPGPALRPAGSPPPTGGGEPAGLRLNSTYFFY